MVATTTALNDMRDAALDRLETNVLYIAVGTDATTPTVSDTALGSEVKEEAVFSTSRTTDSYSVSMFLDATEANGNTIAEVGTKDGASGNLYSRSLTNSISKTATTEVFVEVKYTVTVSNS